MSVGRAARLATAGAGIQTALLFNPLTDISWHTVFWGSDPSQVAPANGAVVTSWRDGSGNNRTFNVIPTGRSGGPNYISSIPTLNEKAGLSFSNGGVLGTGTFTALNQPFSLVFIGHNGPGAQPSTNSSNAVSVLGAGMGIDGPDLAGGFPGKFVAWTWSQVSGQSGVRVAYNPTAANTALLAVAAINGSSSKEVFANTVQTSALGVGTATRLTLGAFDAGADIEAWLDNWFGEIAFVGLYAGDITAHAKYNSFLLWVSAFYNLPTPAVTPPPPPPPPGTVFWTLPTGGTIVLTDDFNRANSTTTLGSPWVVSPGTG